MGLTADRHAVRCAGAGRFRPRVTAHRDCRSGDVVQVEGSDTVTWTAIAPAADVELIVPKSYEGQGAFLAELATAIKTTLS